MQHLIVHLPFEGSKSSKLKERFNTQVSLTRKCRIFISSSSPFPGGS